MEHITLMTFNINYFHLAVCIFQQPAPSTGLWTFCPVIVHLHVREVYWVW